MISDLFFLAEPDAIPATQLPKVYKILEKFGLETGAFSQLSRDYMLNDFNPKTPNLDSVRSVVYLSIISSDFSTIFN